MRYYEEIALVGPVDRDASSGHRPYRSEDLDTLQALACLRATGVSIEDMRTYQANRKFGGPQMSRGLVTGGSGYVATQLIAALLRDGRSVRVMARSTAREPHLRAAVRRGDADDAGLDVVAADPMVDDGWAAALVGCEEVHHVASPIPVTQPEDVAVTARAAERPSRRNLPCRTKQPRSHRSSPT